MKNPSLPQCLWGFDLLSSWLAGEGRPTYYNFTHKMILMYLLLVHCAVLWIRIRIRTRKNFCTGSGCDFLIKISII
jgi:hypothetical protein